VTEVEWLACTDPTPMLDFLRGRASNRKLRLFACACWRRAWRFLRSEADRDTIELAERFADSLATVAELPEPFDEDGKSAWPYVCYPPAVDAPYHSDVAAYMVACTVADSVDNSEVIFTTERRSQADLLRDVFGSVPIVARPIDNVWLTETITNLASMIYGNRAFDRMPELADALEDAGCTAADVLAHCRSQGPHVRGCWVMDLLLGKD
jgi:hypothetical protein